MDIQAAKNLFSTTFHSRPSAASKKPVTAIDAVKLSTSRDNPPQPRATYQARATTENKPIQEQNATPNSTGAKANGIPSGKASLVVEHRSDQFTRAYLTVADTRSPKHQIDTFA